MVNAGTQQGTLGIEEPRGRAGGAKSQGAREQVGSDCAVDLEGLTL